MFQSFDGTSADDAWQQMAAAFGSGKFTIRHSGRGGETDEILHVGISIADPRQRWVTSRQPALNPAFAMAEVVWIIRGRNDAAFLNYFNSRLPNYAGFGESYHGAYGFRLRHKMGIDQLERAYTALLNRPESRQVVLQIWDSRCDFPSPDGTPINEDIPCNLFAMLKVRNGFLDWTQVMRSTDLFLGIPHNFVQFTTLQEVMAGWLFLKPGTYNHFSDSLHVYHRDLENLALSTAAPAPLNEDYLAFPKDVSDHCFRKLEKHIERIIAPGTPADDLRNTLESSQLPRPFRNILCVLVAEGLRRRGDPFAGRAMESCTNPLFGFLWDRWLRRLG